jgi:hypothetical protein
MTMLESISTEDLVRMSEQVRARSLATRLKGRIAAADAARRLHLVQQALQRATAQTIELEKVVRQYRDN